MGRGVLELDVLMTQTVFETATEKKKDNYAAPLPALASGLSLARRVSGTSALLRRQ